VSTRKSARHGLGTPYQNAVPVVLDLQELHPAVLDRDLDRGGLGIDAVFNHLLDRIGRSMQDLYPARASNTPWRTPLGLYLSCGDPIDDDLVEFLYARHFVAVATLRKKKCGGGCEGRRLPIPPQTRRCLKNHRSLPPSLGPRKSRPSSKQSLSRTARWLWGDRFAAWYAFFNPAGSGPSTECVFAC